MNELSEKWKIRLKHILTVVVVFLLIIVLSFVYRVKKNEKVLSNLELKESLIENITKQEREIEEEEKKEKNSKEYQEAMGVLFNTIGEQYGDNEDVQKIVKEAQEALAINPRIIGDSLESKVYVRTFELAWNEFIEGLGVESIELEEQNDYVDYLNKKIFTKEDLDENSYYVISGIANQDLRNKIVKDIKEKFNKESDILDNINFDGEPNHYVIYSTLNKTFTFKSPFTESRNKFKNSENLYMFSELSTPTVGETTFEQVEALFYNSENDFAVKIDTKEGDELILYRSDDINDFSDSYYGMVNKMNDYVGRTTIEREKDEVLFPFINFDVIKEVEEVSGKKVKDMDVYIEKAVEDIIFNLDNFGGNLSTDAYVDIYLSASMEEPRYFYFTDDFMIFLREKDTTIPYFSLYVNDENMLVPAEANVE